MLMFWRLLRWHAFIILKGFSKKGLSADDYRLPDELAEKRASKKTPDEIEKFAKEADRIMAEKYNKE